jgi:hypothetical protein
MSTPLVSSVHTIRVSAKIVSTFLRIVLFHAQPALLFLEAILLAYLSLKEESIGLVFGLNDDARFLVLRTFDLSRSK